VTPPPGRIGFLSQSGALGLAVIDRARILGLGLSTFVSNGNKPDISGNDLLGYWETDDDTDVILLYLESFGNPRKFARIARRVGQTKPIVAVKSGRSAAGARATSSHTGALIATSDVTVDALFRQSGVIRCDTLAELFDVAALLGSQPAPDGNRVAIVTNAGGLGILCADACEAEGLEVVDLPGRVKDELRSFLPAEASVDNPVDMIASASGESYGRAVRAVASCEEVDAIIAIFIPPLVTRPEDVAAALRSAAEEIWRPVPLLTVFVATAGIPDELGGDIPAFAFPEEAARVLARAARYGAWRKRPAGVIPHFHDVRRDEAAAVIARALAGGGGWLGPADVAALLDCYGIPLAAQRVVSSPEEAGHAADELGGRVALKGVAPALVHKTEAGAVRLDLAGAEAVETAATEMRDGVTAAGATLEGFLVQAMAPQGIEVLVGVVHDELFGPVVAVGAGGTTAELMKDVAVRITPLTDHDADEMLRSLKTFPLLVGYRGSPACDVDTLIGLLLRVGAMVETHREVAEMDCNPVMALPNGAIVVDARIRVEVPGPPLPLGARRRV
jgi:acyl-CoA synthetase (NDP forming)